MNAPGTPLRVAGFLTGLLAVFGLSLALGRAVGPLDVAIAGSGHEMSSDQSAPEPTGQAGDGMAGMPGMGADQAVGALDAEQDGYTLALIHAALPAGPQRLEFQVTGPDGAPVTAYDVEHGKALHLVVVRRDLTGFQHVHPVLDRVTGTWSADVRLTPGEWRVIADFTPTGGQRLTLGQDLSVPGGFAAQLLGPEARTAVVDDYTVTLAGDLVAGQEARLALTVTRGGLPVTDLQPYLGSYGHLVALRAEDVGYLHVHPDGAPGEVPAGPEVVFHAEVPSAGGYRLFLDFRHAGSVHTAAFTVHVPDSAGASTEGGGGDVQ